MFESTLKQLCDTTQRLRQRRLIVVSGSATWCRERAATLLGAAPGKTLWIGDTAPNDITALAASQSRKTLGSEVDRLVFDAHCGFDPDAFGATLGTIRGGGLAVLLTPPVARWPQFADPQNRRIAVAGYDPAALSARYITRLIRVLRDDPYLWWLEQDAPLPPLPADPPLVDALPTPPAPPFRTQDQARAVAAIIHTASGHRHRPTVLTADRGRGKSAAMGIAAAQLIRERDLYPWMDGMPTRRVAPGILPPATLARPCASEAARRRAIVVTAPRRDAAEPVFELCTSLGAQTDALEFLPPDELVRHPPITDLLLVDEAAGIPAPLLAQMLARFPRIVFATTVHGYEGTGRGFALRFQRLLDRETPHWQAVQLDTPIRWASGDPVEVLAFRALLMDAGAAPDAEVADARPDTCPVEFVDRDLLLEDEPLLRELFGLLVNAHYRTTPLDLRHLLDGPNLAIAVQRHRGHVVATALVAREGGFDAVTARAIWSGRRRPHGHLLAQSLAAYLGIEEGPQLVGARILRIAVHPAVQRRGFGRSLIERLCATSHRDGLDYLGSSFGATPELMRFWSACECLPIRIGHRREASSGQHSALLLRPLSERGRHIAALARERYRHSLQCGLGTTLADLEPELTAILLEETAPVTASALDEHDWRDLVAFAFALRGYESAQASIELFVAQAMSHPDGPADLPPADVALLTHKVVQHHDWAVTVKALKLSGRREAVARLRKTIGTLLRRQPESWIHDLIAATAPDSA